MKSHEHMLTENSMSVGHAVCAIVNQKAPSVLVDQVARMKSPVLARGESSTSPTRTSTTSSTTSSHDDEAKGVSGKDSPSSKSQRQMEQNGPEAHQKIRMARQRHPTLAGAKGLLALCALSVPLDYMRGLEGASTKDGFPARLPVAASSRTRCVDSGFQLGQSGRLPVAEKPSGHQGGFHGGPSSGWNAGCQGRQGCCPSSQEGSLCRSPTRSSSFGSSRSSEGGCWDQKVDFLLSRRT